MKSKPKSCSCEQCQHSKRTVPGKRQLHDAERSFRHAAKIALNQGKEDIPAAPSGPRVG